MSSLQEREILHVIMSCLGNVSDISYAVRFVVVFAVSCVSRCSCHLVLCLVRPKLYSFGPFLSYSPICPEFSFYTVMNGTEDKWEFN